MSAFFSFICLFHFLSPWHLYTLCCICTFFMKELLLLFEIIHLKKRMNASVELIGFLGTAFPVACRLTTKQKEMNPFNIKQNSDTFYSISTSVCSKIKMKSNKKHQKKNSWLPKHQRYLCFKTKQMAGARGRKIFNRQWQVTEIYTHTSLNESTRGRKRLNSWDIFTVGCMWKTTTSPPLFFFFLLLRPTGSCCNEQFVYISIHLPK